MLIIIIVIHNLAGIPDDESGDAYYAKAYRAIAEKDYTTASESVEKAVELGCSRQYQAHALNLMGTFAFLKGDTASALNYFNKAVEADPKFVQSYIKRSSIYMEQGKEKEVYFSIDSHICLIKGDIESTYKQFDEAIAINPSDPDIYYHRGQGKIDIQ
jgi:import receptor subunit TOM70